MTIAQIRKEYGTVRSLVEKVLEYNLDSRSSDTILYLCCLEELGINTVKEAKGAGLNVITIHKLRQVIQNKEKRFLPKEEIIEARRNRSKAVRAVHSEYIDQEVENG